MGGRAAGAPSAGAHIKLVDPEASLEAAETCSLTTLSGTMSFRNVNPAKVATIKHINNLITCLVNIKDETGEFLMPLADGRIIDTKGWEDWEVSSMRRYR